MKFYICVSRISNITFRFPKEETSIHIQEKYFFNPAIRLSKKRKKEGKRGNMSGERFCMNKAGMRRSINIYRLRASRRHLYRNPP